MATYWENSCSFGLRYVSWYKYLIVSLVFSHLGFWSGNLFLIAPFPDLCLLVPFDGAVEAVFPLCCLEYEANVHNDRITLPATNHHLNIFTVLQSLKLFYFLLSFGEKRSQCSPYEC